MTTDPDRPPRRREGGRPTGCWPWGAADAPAAAPSPRSGGAGAPAASAVPPAAPGGLCNEWAPELEVDEDLAFQQRLWRAQRCAWGLLLAFIAAAALGLTGRGPLSYAETGGPVRVAYERFVRREAPTTVRVSLAAGAGRSGRVSVWIDRRYFERVDLDEVTPQPIQTEASADRFTFTFAVPVPSDSTAVLFRFSPGRMGVGHARVGLGGGPPVVLTQFIYP